METQEWLYLIPCHIDLSKLYFSCTKKYLTVEKQHFFKLIFFLFLSFFFSLHASGFDGIWRVQMLDLLH